MLHRWVVLEKGWVGMAEVDMPQEASAAQSYVLESQNADLMYVSSL